MRSFIFLNLIACFILFFTPRSQAQTLEDRVETLEKTLSLESMIENEVRSQSQKQWYLIAFSALGIVLVIFGGWREVWHRARTYADAQIAEKLAEHFETKKDVIIKWIKENEKEQTILQNTRVLVLSYEDSFQSQTPAAVEKALDQFKPARQVVYHTLPHEEEPALKNPDLIFLNDANGKFPQELAEKYLAETDQAALFYFGGKRLNIKLLNANPYASTANLASQVYGNMLNLLKMRTQSEA